MFSRRKSRSVHSTAYTGVNHKAPETSQPNSGALAAALTIGQNIKSGGDGTNISRSGSLANRGTNNNYNYIKRSSSIQSFRPPSQNTNVLNGGTAKSNSLLRRSPSVTSTRPKSQQNFQNFSSTPSSVDSMKRNSMMNPHSSSSGGGFGGGFGNMNDTHSLDYSINEEPSEGDSSYNNHETVKDLKLSHQTKVKMVKKYVPTPNGIKIIEVPESNMQKEISRNNSIRSGANIPRSGSINSLTNPIRTAKRKPSLRLSSLIKSPPLGLMREEPEAVFNKEKSPEQVELDILQKKIQEEKDLGKKLELKRLEYEELKNQRLLNESKLREMEDDITNLENENDPSLKNQIPIPIAESVPAAIVVKEEFEPPQEEDLGINSDLITSSPLRVVEKPILNDLSTLETEPDNNFISPTVSNYKDNESATSDYPSIEQEPMNDIVPKNNNVKIPESDPYYSSDTDDVVPESAIDPSKLKVDEVDIKKSHDYDETVTTNVNDSQIDNSQLDMTLNKDDLVDDNFGIEEVAFGNDDTPVLDKSRPTFETVPSIITDSEPPITIDNNNNLELIDSTEINQNELRAPNAFTSGGSSASSISSDASPSRSAKKPMKSAMKNSSSFYNTSNVSSQLNNTNAARDAYLSLTTAENTRLNSKLSASQLTDINTNSQSHHYPTSTSLNKRMSTTLRKPPPNSGNNNNNSNQGLAHKTLRPQSMQVDNSRTVGNGFHNVVQERPMSQINVNHSGNNANGISSTPSNGNTNNGGVKSRMSNRSLRDRSSVYVQPIAAHPALDPNYQSPSKLKAAELYAKANKRPVSTFNLQRKSSFSNEHSLETDGKIMGRTTLRSSQPPQQHQYQSHPQSHTPVKNNVDSRFSNSDDDAVHTSNGGGFTSRLVDSDDEAPAPARTSYATTAPVAASAPAPAPTHINKYLDPMLTLRAQPAPKKEKSGAPKDKEKKKLGGRLKKLFGRS